MNHRLRRATWTVAAASLLAALVPAASASAAITSPDACDATPLSQPFAQWGDSADYKLAPGGDMESGLSGWTVRGAASLVADSESYAVTGQRGAAAVSLPAGASVTSPATCVDASYPSFRFFARSSGGLLGLLPAMKVELVYHDSLLGLVAIPVGTVLPSSSWKPTPVMLTAAAVAGLVDGGTSQLSLRFTSLAGTWRIDDVFIDPMRRG